MMQTFEFEERDVQDSEYGIEMEDFKPGPKGDIPYFRPSDLEDIQLGDSSHLISFLEQAANAIPGQIPYMKHSAWRKGEEALRAYKPLWKILKYGNEQPFKKFGEFLRLTKSEIDRFATTDKTRTPTHVTMCGSNLEILEKDEPKFLEVYAALISSGCRCYFVERPTEVYRYFCDFDFKQLSVISDRTIEAAAMVAQSVVRKFYPSLVNNEDALKAIVCTTDAKRVPANGITPELIKTGMHILWPGLFVSVQTSLDIRESMLVEMQNVFGLRVEPSNSWEDVIDVSVYPDINKKGSGLRMLGSCKSTTCSICKGSKKQNPKDKASLDCLKCKGVGKLDEGRPYFPLMVLTSMGKRDVKSELEYLENMHKLIVDTKIRTSIGTLPTEGYQLPDGAPVYLSSEPGRIRRQGGTDVVDRGGGRIRSTIGTLPHGQKIEVSRSDPVWPAIETMIRNHPCGMYSQIIVNQITTNAKRTKFTSHINGPYSHYCQNKGAVHSSNRVFFEFDSTGFVQKCFGSKPGIHGLCGPTYKSSTEPLSTTDLGILFPDAKYTYLKALDACRETLITEKEEEEQDTAFLGRKMRTLLLAGDFLSNFLFGNLSNTSSLGTLSTNKNSKVNESELCLWSRTLRNEGRFFVNVGSFSPDKMDTYVEIESAALGTKRNAVELLGFKSSLKESSDDDQMEERTEVRKSLFFLKKQLFESVTVLLNKYVDLDQTALKKEHSKVYGLKHVDVFEVNLLNKVNFREYDADTLEELQN